MTTLSVLITQVLFIINNRTHFDFLMSLSLKLTLITNVKRGRVDVLKDNNLGQRVYL